MGREKLIDTWFYDVKDLEDIEVRRNTRLDVDEDEDEPAQIRKVITKKVEIKLFLDKDTVDEGHAPYALKKVEFVVRCSEPRFKYSGTDIEALRAMAWSHLGEHFKIKWESYYLVKVRPERVYDGMGTGLSFSYDWVYKGTTWDGKELLKQHQPYQREDKISPWPGRFTDQRGETLACIPATDANGDALREFGKRIDTLRDLIRDTLRPETIMQTLQNLAGLALLPPAEKEKVTDDEN